jgi:hypothetical protein
MWHKAFGTLLESIVLLLKTGFFYICFDGVSRILYPIILILSADYEEQQVLV